MLEREIDDHERLDRASRPSSVATFQYEHGHYETTDSHATSAPAGPMADQRAYWAARKAEQRPELAAPDPDRSAAASKPALWQESSDESDERDDARHRKREKKERKDKKAKKEKKHKKEKRKKRGSSDDDDSDDARKRKKERKKERKRERDDGSDSDSSDSERERRRREKKRKRKEREGGGDDATAAPVQVVYAGSSVNPYG